MSRFHRENLAIGDIVKLAVIRADSVPERFWAIVKTRTRTGQRVKYTGEVTNNLAFTQGPLAYGDTVKFGPQHVLIANRKIGE